MINPPLPAATTVSAVGSSAAPVSTIGFLVVLTVVGLLLVVVVDCFASWLGRRRSNARR